MSTSVDELITVDRSPLSLDGWLAWNEDKWGLKAERVVYTPKGKEIPRLEGVLYLDNRGRVRIPPRNPYLPFHFEPTPTNKRERIYRQRMKVMKLLAEDLAQRGVKGSISLPPGFVDGRIFKWSGFEISLKYTFLDEFPIREDDCGRSIRKNIRKADSSGFAAERSRDWEGIAKCLKQTGKAKDFSHRTTADDLQACHDLLGDDVFRGYVGRNPENAIVCGHLRLFQEGGVVLGWSAGTVRSYLTTGINQLTYKVGFEDMAKDGGAYFDFVGANIQSVARAKSKWALPLVPYLTIRQKNFRHVARTVYHFGRDLVKKVRS